MGWAGVVDLCDPAFESTLDLAKDKICPYQPEGAGLAGRLFGAGLVQTFFPDLRHIPTLANGGNGYGSIIFTRKQIESTDGPMFVDLGFLGVKNAGEVFSIVMTVFDPGRGALFGVGSFAPEVLQVIRKMDVIDPSGGNRRLNIVRMSE